MKLPVKILNKSPFPLPEYATPYSSGVDLRADLINVFPEGIKMEINPLERQIIPTGIFIEIPIGYEAQIRPRSGLAIKIGLTILNTPGTIDPDYRGEIGIIVINLSKKPIVIGHGDRIAQMVFVPVVQAEWIPIKDESEFTNTKRGNGGFGHTGK